MHCKAVLFDLFETLITEWGHEKYTKSRLCADLGLQKEQFDRYWDEMKTDRYTSDVSFAEQVLHVCRQCGRSVDSALLAAVTQKRMQTKAACFAAVDPDVYRLLEALQAMGLRLAIVSNCCAEEVSALQQSGLSRYFAQTVLSYQVHLQKPDRRIYLHAAGLLGTAAEACLFVGDGGSQELPGAQAAGMQAVRAAWYTDRHPNPRGEIAGFPTAKTPPDILQYLC